jgi:hypothetical protein
MLSEETSATASRHQLAVHLDIAGSRTGHPPKRWRASAPRFLSAAQFVYGGTPMAPAVPSTKFAFGGNPVSTSTEFPFSRDAPVAGRLSYDETCLPNVRKCRVPLRSRLADWRPADHVGSAPPAATCPGLGTETPGRRPLVGNCTRAVPSRERPARCPAGPDGIRPHVAAPRSRPPRMVRAENTGVAERAF